MKKILSVLAGMFIAVNVWGTMTYEKTLVNGVVATSATYSLDMDYYNIENVSFQAVFSTDSLSSILVDTNAVNASFNLIATTVAYPLGYALLITTNTGYAFTSPILTDTTYYAIPSSISGYMYLAFTSSSAFANYPLVFSTTPGTGTINMTGLPMSGSFVSKWQGSNDNTNWYQIMQGTIAASFTATTATVPNNILWDFGYVSYRYIRYKVIPAISGCLTIKVLGHGKRQ